MPGNGRSHGRSGETKASASSSSKSSSLSSPSTFDTAWEVQLGNTRGLASHTGQPLPAASAAALPAGTRSTCGMGHG